MYNVSALFSPYPYVSLQAPYSIKILILVPFTLIPRCLLLPLPLTSQPQTRCGGTWTYQAFDQFCAVMTYFTVMLSEGCHSQRELGSKNVRWCIR